MPGHGEKLNRRREAAIAALLRHPTVGDAAQAIGVHERTLRRWLGQLDFRAAFDRAAETALADAIARLGALAGEAVETLRAGLRGELKSSQVRSAIGILEQAGRLRRRTTRDDVNPGTIIDEAFIEQVSRQAISMIVESGIEPPPVPIPTVPPELLRELGLHESGDAANGSGFHPPAPEDAP